MMLMLMLVLVVRGGGNVITITPLSTGGSHDVCELLFRGFYSILLRTRLLIVLTIHLFLIYVTVLKGNGKMRKIAPPEECHSHESHNVGILFGL